MIEESNEGKSVRRNVRIKDLFEEEDHRVDKEGKKLIEGR